MAAGYINPFGGYATGYNQGVDQEMGVQRGARDARQEDWQHQYVDPLKLNAARREDTYGTAAMPYQISALNYGSEQLAADTQEKRMRAALERALYLRDPSALNAIGHDGYRNYTNQPDSELLAGADWQRNFALGGLGVNQMRGEAGMARAEADQAFRAAQVEHWSHPNGGGAPAYSPATNYFGQPGAAPEGAAPEGGAPTAGPGLPPIGTPPDPALMGGADPQASAIPFHAMHPQLQGHVINSVAQALNVPHEQALAHIQSQPGGAPPIPSTPQAAPPGVDASKYYA